MTLCSLTVVSHFCKTSLMLKYEKLLSRVYIKSCKNFGAITLEVHMAQLSLFNFHKYICQFGIFFQTFATCFDHRFFKRPNPTSV